MKEDFILKLLEKFDNGSSVILHIKDKDTELVVKKAEAIQTPCRTDSEPEGICRTQAGSSNTVQPSKHNVPHTENRKNYEQAAGGATDARTVHLKSPIVGTFYRSPSPDAPPYVEKGTRVKKGDPLCILEAMKMMNTLEAEVDGIIEEILPTNGDLVEFDQHIFTVRVEQ